MTALFFASVAAMAAAVIAALALRGKGRGPLYALMTGTFLALALLLLALPGAPLERLLKAVYGAAKALAFSNADLAALQERMAKGMPWVQTAPSALRLWAQSWAAALYLFAALLSMQYVLSFIKKYGARLWYLLGFFSKRVFVFSSQCPQSEALAKSLRERLHARMAFFDPDVRLHMHRPGAEITLFAIGEDEPANVTQALRWIEKYRYRNHTTVCVFSESVESELLLGAAMAPRQGRQPGESFKVRRINPAQALVCRTLYAPPAPLGDSIFGGAKDTGGEEKLICAVVFGLGRLGGEMAKALCWFGQMDGYKLQVHAFEKDPEAVRRFSESCPGLLEHRGKGGQGEDRYELELYTDAAGFDAALRQIPATYVFVALGGDGKNLDMALNLRVLFEREGHTPDILAVVRDPEKARRLREGPLVNFKGKSYDITVVGSLEEQYAWETILDSELEKEACRRHVSYAGNDKDFYRFEYNFRSSMAAAIHAEWRRRRNIHDDDAPELEHRRWNAYMRGQGYVYDPERNDRAKTHPDLVSFQALSDREKEKDRAMTQPR